MKKSRIITMMFILTFMTVGFLSPTGCRTTISGKVYDENKNPVHGVTVAVEDSYPVTTGADGGYVIEGMAFGEHLLTATSGDKKAVKTISVSPVDSFSCQDVSADIQFNNWKDIGIGSAAGGGISSNSGDSEYSSVVIDNAGNPVVAWQDETSGQWNIYVKRWDGQSWQETGSDSATGGGITGNSGCSRYPAIAVNKTGGEIYVTWEKENPSGFIANSEIFIKKWDGISWQEAGAGSASCGGISDNTGISKSPSMAMDNAGNPVIAWEDSTPGNVEIYLRKYNGISWEELGGSVSGGGISGNAGSSRYPCIAVDGSGCPVVAWEDDTSGDVEIYVRKWDGEQWTEMGKGSASGGGISDNKGYSIRPALSTNDSGNVVVVWQDYSSGDVEIYAKSWNGTNWEELAGSASCGGLSDNSGDSCKPSAVIDDGGNITICWSDFRPLYGGIYVKQWDGMNWVELGDGSAAAGGISNSSGKAMNPSIALDGSGDYFVVWQNTTESSQEIYGKKWLGKTTE